MILLVNAPVIGVSMRCHSLALQKAIGVSALAALPRKAQWSKR